jgi:transcriptional regulator with XRE-family HTH domain
MAQVELGERIATLREEQALTQADLAERARISPSTLSQIESGKVPRPHVGTVRKIARALGVEPQDLRRAEELVLTGAFPKAEAPQETGQLDQAKLREWFEEFLRAAQPLAEQSDETIALAREAAERQARGEPPIAVGFVEDEPPERAALEAAFLRFIQEQREHIVEAARVGK